MEMRIFHIWDEVGFVYYLEVWCFGSLVTEHLGNYVTEHLDSYIG